MIGILLKKLTEIQNKAPSLLVLHGLAFVMVFFYYANTKGFAHFRFKSDGKQQVKGVYHIQNVNSYHSRLKKWMDRFNGVATKYLHHYLAWFRYIDSKEYENTTSNKKNMLVKSCLFTVTDTNTKLRLSVCTD